MQRNIAERKSRVNGAYLTEKPYDVLVRIDTPGPGVAALGAVTYPGGEGMVAMNLYLYGDQAVGAVARETAVWHAWFKEHFPTPTLSSHDDARAMNGDDV